MNEFSTYEYVVRQRIEGRWIVARAGLVFLYVCFVLAWLLFGFRTRILWPLLALIPISLWVLVFMTWRYVSVEYEYSITSGVMTFAKIFGSRSRRTFLTLTLRDAVRIAPLDNAAEAARAAQWRPEREFHAISSLRSPDVYFLLFEYQNPRTHEKRRAILYFEATERTLQICRFYNPSATVTGKTRH